MSTFGCKSPFQKDTTLTKLFVGGLPYHTKDEGLRKVFEKFGEIEEAVVITDRNSGQSKGYGFVTMANAEDARKACMDPNPIIEGRKANVNLAIIGAKQRTIPGVCSTIPIAIKPGIPGLSSAGLPAMHLASLQSQYAGYPLGSVLYQNPYHQAQSMMAVSPQSPLSTGGSTTPFIDYTNPYAQYTYDPAYANALAAAQGLFQPGYTLGALPQAALAESPAAGLAGYAPQQIQERLQ